MRKACLVIDMPESCSKCKFMYEFYGVKKCQLLNILRNGGKAILSQEEFTKKRSSKCPLVPIPEKMLRTGEGWEDGWNAAIDAIGGNDSDGK